MSRCSASPASRPVLQVPQVPLSQELATRRPLPRRASRRVCSALTSTVFPLFARRTLKGVFSAYTVASTPKLSKCTVPEGQWPDMSATLSIRPLGPQQ
jgi:hypothetical protein